MKKLVAAACALAAGMVLADSAVTSGNIVGCISIEAQAQAFTPMSIMLTDVGQNTIALTNLQFSGISRGDEVQIFDGDGNVETTISMGRGNVWSDTSYVFQPGDAFWLLPKNAVTCAVAGEVKRTALVINASSNEFTPMGNGTAAPVAITNITFSGISRGDEIQIFDGDGNVETTISMGRGNVWSDTSYVFQPGDSFWLLPKNAVTVTFPAPTIAE